MQNKQEDKKVKVETKRIRARNLHQAFTEVVETFNSSQGWALVKATQMGMGVDVYLERSALQGNEKQSEDVKPTEKVKVVSDVKTEENTLEKTEKDTAPEKQSEDKVDDTANSKPKTTAKRTTNRAKK